MKTRYCDECANGLYSARLKFSCAKNHKPRFYVPSLDPRDTDWGYKRKCQDFQPKGPK